MRNLLAQQLVFHAHRRHDRLEALLLLILGIGFAALENGLASSQETIAPEGQRRYGDAVLARGSLQIGPPGAVPAQQKTFRLADQRPAPGRGATDSGPGILPRNANRGWIQDWRLAESAAVASPTAASMNALLWPAKSPEPASPVAAATAPALAVLRGRMTEQTGKFTFRNVHGLGITAPRSGR